MSESMNARPSDPAAPNPAVPNPAVSEPTRCSWAAGTAAMIAYHDTEWGVPLHDDKRLFEMLTLEGAQAGLSWRTVLDRRHEYRRAFHDFDIAKVAAMTDAALTDLLTNSGIIRNRLKIWSTRTNAQAALHAAERHGSFDAYLWSLVPGAPIRNHRADRSQVPARTPESDAMSKQLRKDGFSFVGTTICYALMQATGMVNDHLTECFCWAGPPKP